MAAGEALDKRDGGDAFGGLDVTQALAAVNGEIATALAGRDASDQHGCDEAMIALDGTPNKARLGANVILGVSLGLFLRILFGAAAAIVPVGVIWFGVIKLALDGRLWPRPLVGFGVLLLCGAVFLDAADWFFTGWAERCNLPSTGGVVGNGLGEYVMMKLLGRTGTLLVSGGAYLVAMILITGQQPIVFLKSCARAAWEKYGEWRENRNELEETAAKEEEFISERERQREQRRREREAQKAAEKAEEESRQPMLP